MPQKKSLEESDYVEMNREDFFKAWSHLHGGARISGVVKGWLAISFGIAKILNKLMVSPNALTFFGLIFALFTCINSQSLLAALFLVFSLACDGLDGSLAIIKNQVSSRGAILDAVADRISESFWALTFYYLGAPLWIVLIAWLAAFTQEYVRARAGGLGLREVGVVTIGERPIRASLLFVAIVANALTLNYVATIATLWCVIQVLSFISVSRFAYKNI